MCCVWVWGVVVYVCGCGCEAVLQEQSAAVEQSTAEVAQVCGWVGIWFVAILRVVLLSAIISDVVSISSDHSGPLL